MPVIERLDKQVNDILITPLNNRTTLSNRDQAEDAPQKEITPPHNIEVSEATKAEKMSGTQEPLPVWLL